MIRSNATPPTLAGPPAFHYVRARVNWKRRTEGTLHIVTLHGRVALCGVEPFAKEPEPQSPEDAKRVCRNCVAVAGGWGLFK